MENIIKLNINKTANRKTEIFPSWKQYTVARATVQSSSPILIFVVTLYNDLAAREGQPGSALTVLEFRVDWSGLGVTRSAPHSAHVEPRLLSWAVNQWDATHSAAQGSLYCPQTWCQVSSCQDSEERLNMNSNLLIQWSVSAQSSCDKILMSSVCIERRRKYQWQRFQCLTSKGDRSDIYSWEIFYKKIGNSPAAAIHDFIQT